MDIEKLIESECKYQHEDSDSGIHDRAYKAQIIEAYKLYKDFSLGQLKVAQLLARDEFKVNGSTHAAVAKCMVVAELIKDKE